MFPNWEVLVSNPSQVQWRGGPDDYNNLGCSARLKTSFELNPVTEDKQGTFPFLTNNALWQTLNSRCGDIISHAQEPVVQCLNIVSLLIYTWNNICKCWQCTQNCDICKNMEFPDSVYQSPNWSTVLAVLESAYVSYSNILWLFTSDT